MNYRSNVVLCICLSLLFPLSGCKQSSSSLGGFAVSTAERTQSSSGALSPPRPIADVHVTGVYIGTIGNELQSGTVQSYDGYEGQEPANPDACNMPVEYQQSNNYYWVCYGKAPALWTIDFQIDFYCGDTNLQYVNISNYPSGSSWTYQLLNQEVFPISGVEGDCLTKTIAPASTRFAILGQLPQTLTLTGEAPFTTIYGMPKLYVYDGTATLVATETATIVSDDGLQATFPFPSSLQQNGYSVAVANQTNIGSGISTVGTNYLSIASSQTIAGNPFGVAAQVISTTRQSADNPDPYGDGTCAGQWVFYSDTYTNTVPVVTLYSLNQVNNGGATIPVGLNPTAIALYDSQDDEDDRSNGPCHSSESDTTQMSRAVVANSGSNTLSVLDIVNNTVLSTITVGNQPVALVLSSDGNTAYVANYTDGTVTQVNLTTQTATATVAVGGKPTSVTITSAGTLWVGGVGFLTQMNSRPMSVVATETVTNKTIVALGFSNSVNQLVATTVDTNGNVYADEINPSTFQRGGVYAPLASNMVSTVGTHSVHSGPVHAFTATLAGANQISANQVGAPPLVVQDGWAVITATPTGFTITDITGQIVLVSETTPSPVTAIAVDYGLNVAYLVMPDSNILLTVPLPGTH